MALLDEQLVEEWLNRKNFFTMRGIKSGVDEIDLLAIRPTQKGVECWHEEVQISYRPVGYIGGDTNARKRTDKELREGVEQCTVSNFNSIVLLGNFNSRIVRMVSKLDVIAIRTSCVESFFSI